MQVDILHQPDSAIAKVSLDAHEEILAEAGAMIAMNGHIHTTTTLRQGKGGGIMGGLKRMLAGESLFISSFRADRPGEVYLAPSLLGDIYRYDLQGSELIVQSKSYLACVPSVTMDLGFQGFKSFFSGESIFWITFNGHGMVLLSSFGGIYPVAVDGEYVVDTGHIVAFENTLSFSITKAGAGWIGSFLGGEGLVCRFQGRGLLLCQTHNPGAFGQAIGSRLPPK